MLITSYNKDINIRLTIIKSKHLKIKYSFKNSKIVLPIKLSDKLDNINLGDCIITFSIPKYIVNKYDKFIFKLYLDKLISKSKIKNQINHILEVDDNNFI